MGGVPRWLPERWPLDDVGVVLWSLSRVAGEWQGADTLTASCTVSDEWMPEAEWNPAAMLFAMRILRPLLWFGLMNCWERSAGGGSRRGTRVAVSGSVWRGLAMVAKAMRGVI